MNIEVTVVQTSCAVRASSIVTFTKKPGRLLARVSAIGSTGVTSIAFCSRPTRSSIDSLFISD